MFLQGEFPREISVNSAFFHCVFNALPTLRATLKIGSGQSSRSQPVLSAFQGSPSSPGPGSKLSPRQNCYIKGTSPILLLHPLPLSLSFFFFFLFSLYCFLVGGRESCTFVAETRQATNASTGLIACGLQACRRPPTGAVLARCNARPGLPLGGSAGLLSNPNK